VIEVGLSAADLDEAREQAEQGMVLSPPPTRSQRTAGEDPRPSAVV